MATNLKLITFEDSLDLPENRFEEIVRGESRAMPPPTDRHEFLLWTLAGILQRQLDTERFGVFPSGFGLGIQRAPYLTYRIPDLTVYERETLRRHRREKAARDPYIWVPPVLLVECISPAGRKAAIDELLADYARIRVPEAWLLFPETPLLIVHRHESGRLTEITRHETGRVAIGQLSGIEIDLDLLWRAFHEGP
jgi:Uma2 family endonuclease